MDQIAAREILQLARGITFQETATKLAEAILEYSRVKSKANYDAVCGFSHLFLIKDLQIKESDEMIMEKLQHVTLMKNFFNKN